MKLGGEKMISRGSRFCFGFVVLAGLIFYSLSGYGHDEIDREAWIERGGSALVPFKKQLMAELKQGLEAGPVAAIEVCRHAAPEIAGEASSPGVRMGRTSHRLRNENNAPKKWMKPLLDEYVKTSGKTVPAVVELEGGGVGYVEPIFVKRMCLVCHGSDLPPAVASRIDVHYPRDEARGFEEGDFRGLSWVEFTNRNADRTPHPCVIELSDTTTHYEPILNGPPQTTAMESGLVILMPGKSGSKHSSKGYEEALVILSGEGELVISGGPTLKLTSNSVAYCPTHTEHQVRNSGTEPLKYVYVAAQVVR